MEIKDKAMAVAVFRFGLISEFVTGLCLAPGEKEKLLREKATRAYKIPGRSSSRVSRSTLKKWIADYQRAGNSIEGLLPAQRKDRGAFRSLDESIQLAIREIKSEDKKGLLTGVGIIRELRNRKYIGLREQINLSVVYRFLKQYHLERPKKLMDRRSFEADHPNELWQSDVLHGPLVKDGSKRRKAYLIAILDDNSRLIPHAEFYFSERVEDLKRCLKSAIEKRGLPQKLYIDNGACYKAMNIEQVTACLGIGIVHTPPYTPEGRGKIERWFRYVREGFLAHHQDALTLDELNEYFFNWVEDYHNKVHSSTGQTPLERYRLNMKCVRPAPPSLIDYFRFIEFRRVKKDRTFRLSGTIFEAPIELIDYRVELRFHRESPDDVEIFHDGRSFGKAILLDRGVNFKVGRNQKMTVITGGTDISPGEVF